jgi:hypothetical protein
MSVKKQRDILTPRPEGLIIHGVMAQSTIKSDEPVRIVLLISAARVPKGYVSASTRLIFVIWDGEGRRRLHVLIPLFLGSTMAP